MKMKYSLFGSLIMILLVCVSCSKSDPEFQDELIQDYLDENNLVTQETESGIHYVITEEGSGSQPTADDYVTVFYVGRLLDGTVFDETTSTVPTGLNLGQTIEGWQECVPLLKRGGQGTFIIPAQLAYGRQGRTNIPGNSPLRFEIELVDF